MARLPPGVTREVPGPGQESVWDYPRPPRWDRASEVVEIWFAGQRVASTTVAIRVLETSHPPTYYLPRLAFREGVLRAAGGTSVCEWKGTAIYLDVVCHERIAPRAAWTYPDPTAAFADLTDHVAVYAAAMDRCTVGGEVVRAQPGGFYGGWVTSDIVGPFKGVPGSFGW